MRQERRWANEMGDDDEGGNQPAPAGPLVPAAPPAPAPPAPVGQELPLGGDGSSLSGQSSSGSSSSQASTPAPSPPPSPPREERRERGFSPVPDQDNDGMGLPPDRGGRSPRGGQRSLGPTPGASPQEFRGRTSPRTARGARGRPRGRSRRASGESPHGAVGPPLGEEGRSTRSRDCLQEGPQEALPGARVPGGRANQFAARVLGIRDRDVEQGSYNRKTFGRKN